MSENNITVGEYQIFQDSSSTIHTLLTSFSTQKEVTMNLKTQLMDGNVFMGPAADECASQLSKVDTEYSSILSKFQEMNNFLATTSASYQQSDKEAKENVAGDTTVTTPTTGTETTPVTTNPISTIPATTVEQTSSKTGENAANKAKEISKDSRNTYALGWDNTKDYFYGDCFGFVLACYEDANLGYDPQTMGGTNPKTASNWLVDKLNKFDKVDYTGTSNLQPGDVVICAKDGQEHAEIYVGDGQYAAAPSYGKDMVHDCYDFGATYVLRYKDQTT